MLDGFVEVLANGRNGVESPSSSSSSSSSLLESLRVWRDLLIAEGRYLIEAGFKRREDKSDVGTSASESESSDDLCNTDLASWCCPPCLDWG